MQDVDAFLLGRRTYVTHAQAFEPMPAGDVFGDMMNAPAKYVVSRTLQAPIWRNTTILRDDVIGAVRALKAGAKAFLQKPVDNAELMAVIKQALGEPAKPADDPVADTGEFPLIR